MATGTWRTCPGIPTVNELGVLVYLAAVGIVVHVSTLNRWEDTHLRSPRLLCMLVSLSSTCEKSEAPWSSQYPRLPGPQSRWYRRCRQLVLRCRSNCLRYGLDFTGEITPSCTCRYFQTLLLLFYIQPNVLTIFFFLSRRLALARTFVNGMASEAAALVTFARQCVAQDAI